MKKVFDVLSVVSFALPVILFAVMPGVFSGLIREALTICAQVVIPSLFLFMIMTQLLTRTGIAEKAGRCLSFIIKPLFGVPDSLCGTVLLGLAAGFPNGAISACIVYEENLCTKEQAERAIALGNNCSAAFICAVCGSHVIGSVKGGLILLSSQFISAVIASVVLRICFGRIAGAPSKPKITAKRRFADALSESVTESCKNMLYVCGFIILFYTISSFICKAEFIGGFEYAVKGFFEVSGAVEACRGLFFPLIYVVCSAIIGFSGLSVIFQVSNVCAAHSVSPREFIFTRIITAVIMPIVTSALLLLLPREAISVANIYAYGYGYPVAYGYKTLIAIVLLYAVFCAVAFLCFAGIYAVSSLLRKKSSKMPKNQAQ